MELLETRRETSEDEVKRNSKLAVELEERTTGGDAIEAVETENSKPLASELSNSTTDTDPRGSVRLASLEHSNFSYPTLLTSLDRKIPQKDGSIRSSVHS